MATPHAPKLIALDLDGTLLRSDQTVDPRDARAIRRALDAGVLVTIATGRVATGALPVAEHVGITAPIVCADGGAVVCPRTRAVQERTAVPSDAARGSVRAFDAHGLAPFVMLLDEIHADQRGQAHFDLVSVWTTKLVVHEHIDHGHEAWGARDTVAFTLGIGPAAQVDRATAQLRAAHGDALETVSFGRSERTRALLARPVGCSKGSALARLAERYGVAPEDTAAVGDWHNDLPMFRWAKRSFAMGQGHDDVKRAATDVLRATCDEGGGVAEALGRWLDW